MAEISRFSFAGGMVAKTGSLKLAENEVPLILNYHLDSVGDLTKRYGYTRLQGQLVDNKNVNGMFMYTNVTTAAQTCNLAVVNNSGDTQGVIYYRTTGAWATSKTNDTASLVTRFATFVNYLFRVNGTDVVATSIAPVTGTWGTTNAPSTITPKLVGVYEDRVYLGNGNTTGQRSRVWFSSLPVSGTSITWDTTNDYIDINPDDNDELTAFENNGNSLLFFKNRAMYRWKFKAVEPDKIIGVGVPNQEAVWTNFDLGITFFTNEYGVWAYTGGYPKNIGRKIQPWIDAIAAATLTSIRTSGDNDHYYIYPGANLTVAGRTYTNPVFVYTISLDAWTIYTLADPVKYFGKYINSSSEDLYFGNDDGEIMQLGGVTVNTDDSGSTAAPIAGEVEFREEFLANKEAKVNDITLYSAQPIGIKWNTRLNRRTDWDITSESTKVINKFTVNKSGNYIQLRAADNSNSRSVIEAYIIDYESHLTEKKI